jgi:hypothetical protein
MGSAGFSASTGFGISTTSGAAESIATTGLRVRAGIATTFSAALARTASAVNPFAGVLTAFFAVALVTLFFFIVPFSFFQKPFRRSIAPEA